MRDVDRYATAATARAYAEARPPVHEAATAAAWRAVGRDRVGVAVDVGCGAGTSTAPLLRRAHRVLGLDPSAAMVAAARLPGARFAVGRAEALPLRDGSVEVLLAAGALDGTDLATAAAEAARVLRPDGVLLAWDVARGRHLAGDPRLDRWYDGFLDRSGRAPVGGDLRARLHEVRPLAVVHDADLALTLPMDLGAYVAYVLSDAADPGDVELRAWCEATLAPLFPGPRDVLFAGYAVGLRPRGPRGGGGWCGARGRCRSGG